MGWYWTNWQQNVNDLKTMIDLVTDKSPEKQKYGIAMFEYLAKNGKVPVEFLAAQIDYATTAENHELLPILEVAIQSASEQNPDVAEAYRVALLRRPSRVFIHVPSDDTYACLVKLREGLKDADKASIFFPAVRKFQGYADSNQELRYFHASDKSRASRWPDCLLLWVSISRSRIFLGRSGRGPMRRTASKCGSTGRCCQGRACRLLPCLRTKARRTFLKSADDARVPGRRLRSNISE